MEKKFKKDQKVMFIPSADRWVGTYDLKTFTYIEKLDDGDDGKSVVISSNGQHIFRTENLWAADYNIGDKVRVIEDVQVAKQYFVPLPIVQNDLKDKLLSGDSEIKSSFLGKVELKVYCGGFYNYWWISLAQITKLEADKTSNFCIECGLLNEYGETNVCGLCKLRTKAFGF